MCVFSATTTTRPSHFSLRLPPPHAGGRHGYGHTHYGGAHYGHYHPHSYGSYGSYGRSSGSRHRSGGGRGRIVVVFPALLTPEQAAQDVASDAFDSVFEPSAAAPAVLAAIAVALSFVCLPLLGAALGVEWKTAACKAAASGDAAWQFKFFLTRALQCSSYTWSSSLKSFLGCSYEGYGDTFITLASQNLSEAPGAGATALLAVALLCALPLCLECCGRGCCSRGAPGEPAAATAASRLQLNAARLFRLLLGAAAAAAGTALGAGGLRGADANAALLASGTCYSMVLEARDFGAPGPALGVAAAALLALAAALQGAYFFALRARWAAVAAAGGAPAAPPAAPAPPTPLQLLALSAGASLAAARQLGSWGADGGLASCVAEEEFAAAGLPANGGVPAPNADLYGAALAVLTRAPLEGPAPPPNCQLVPMVVSFAGKFARVAVPVAGGEGGSAAAGEAATAAAAAAAAAAAPVVYGGIFGSLRNVLSWRSGGAHPAALSYANGGPPPGYPYFPTAPPAPYGYGGAPAAYGAPPPAVYGAPPPPAAYGAMPPPAPGMSGMPPHAPGMSGMPPPMPVGQVGDPGAPM